MSNQVNLLNLNRIKNIQSEINERIFKRVNKSIIFADYEFIEWFNLTVGIDSLIKNGGAFNIKEFSSFENGGENLKAVFFISQPLKGLVLEILKDILVSSKFQFITIITNINPVIYDETPDYFDQIKDNCLMWMNNANYTCDIFYERFSFAILPQNNENSTLLFLNPLCSWSSNPEMDSFNQLVNIDIYQRLVKQEINELHTLAHGTSSGNKDNFQNYYQNLNLNEINELKGLANSINEMLEYLDAKDDCFSLGILSSIVSHELNLSQIGKFRRKNSPNKVSLLLVDRNLDLSINSLFHEETVFDKINNLLPNLCSTSNDVQIDLRNFLYENNFKSVLPGNLFHFSNDNCKFLIEQFLNLKPKECLLDVYRKLCEIYPLNDMSKEKKTFRINAESLKGQMKNGLKINKRAFFENIDLLQIVSAYCQINEPQSTKQVEFDKLITYVKTLTQNILDKEGPSVLSRLYALFNERNEKTPNYTISDLVLLLIYVYGLIGEECFYGIEEEERIKKLLIDELESDAFQNDQRFKSDHEFFNKIKNNQNNAQFIDKFFHNLKSLKFFRKNLKQHNKLLVKSEDKNQYSYKPLIKQICENLMKTNPVGNNTEQLLDIEYRTTNLGGDGIGLNLFKSFKIGFMNASTKIHPLNNDLLIIYFIGGITSYEYKLVKEIFKNSELEKSVLIGSSPFPNQSKLMKYLFN